MTERFKETVTLCLSAFLLAASALTVTADALNGSAEDPVHGSGPVVTQSSQKAQIASTAPPRSGATNVSIASNASSTASRLNGRDPFVMVSADKSQPASVNAPALKASTSAPARTPTTAAAAAKPPTTAVAAAAKPPTTATVVKTTAETGNKDATSRISVAPNDADSLAGRIKWLNQVTSSITDELDMIHPPPMKNLVAQATSSEMAHELEDVGKVFGTVANDLKEGFVGLQGTIESISRGEATGIRLPEHVEARKETPVAAPSTGTDGTLTSAPKAGNPSQDKNKDF